MDGPVCVIPARMASSRYPGKSLEPLLGLPLVFHVYERCRLYERFSEVVIATCDDEILEAAEAHGVPAVMTADSHERCTDRVYEAVETHYPGIAEDAVMNAETLPAVVMPARDRFVPDDRRGGPEVR